MAPPPNRNPQKIDENKSTSWAISSLASVGAGPVSLGNYDLANGEFGALTYGRESSRRVEIIIE